MDSLFAARSQMAMSLAFHIVFAAIGMAMPLLMIIAEGLYWRTGDKGWLTLARKWAKGVSMLFAVGAVSGTVLSFELGLLWPKFMAAAGDVIGMPFSMEGFAFFLEAIFLGLYIYGWGRMPQALHWLAGVGVTVCGLASGAFVVCANAWMNTPAGFRWENGDAVDIDPVAAMFNPAAPAQALHMVIAAYLAVGVGVAGVHAYQLLKAPNDDFHRKALTVALVMAVPSALIMPATGHFAAQTVAETQPVKLAAMEAHWETERWAPFRIGGIPDEVAETTSYALEVPGMLSMMAYNDPNAEVKGLSDVPREDRPPVWPVHIAFQVMIAIGSWLAALAAGTIVLAIRQRGLPMQRWWLWMVVGSAPLGMIAIEAGWTVTEVGRQPWVVYGILRTADAVTPAPGLGLHFLLFSGLYVLLAGVVYAGMRHLVLSTAPGADPHA